MRSFLHIRFSLILGVFATTFLLWACEDPMEEEAKFQVNQQTENSTFTVAPEGGEFQLFVVCDADWSYRFKTQVAWLSAKEKQVNSNSWMLVLTALEHTGRDTRSVVLEFTSGQRKREVTVQQDPEDAIVQVTVPGAYGVPGGDVVYDRSIAQISRLTSGDSFSFSLLYPADVKAVTVTVPSALESGAVVPLSYKVVEKDRTLVMTEYTAATVVAIKEPYVWLRVSDTGYFIIKK